MSGLSLFLECYQKLTWNNLDLLDDIYSRQVEFVDPIHHLYGLVEVKQYFAMLYKGITQISFEYKDTLEQQDKAYVQWVMTFRHPQLAKGESISVAGSSYLVFDRDGKVSFHRDYFDVGALLYENLPLLGTFIRAVKVRVGR